MIQFCFREDWFEDTGSKSNRHQISRHKNQHSNYSALKEEHSSEWRRSEVKGYDTQASTMSGTSVCSGPGGKIVIFLLIIELRHEKTNNVVSEQF